MLSPDPYADGVIPRSETEAICAGGSAGIQPAGITQHENLKTLLSFLAFPAAVAGGYGMYHLAPRLIPQGAFSPAAQINVQGVATLAGVVLAFLLVAVGGRRILRRFAARRELQRAQERLEWSRQMGWAFEPGPADTDPDLVPLVASDGTHPQYVVRGLSGHSGERAGRVETWISVRHRQKHRVQGHPVTRLLPEHWSVISLELSSPLPTIALMAPHLVHWARPPVIAGWDHAEHPDLPMRVISRAFHAEQVRAAVGAQVRELVPRQVIVVASGYRIVLIQRSEPDVEVFSTDLRILGEIADGLATVEPAAASGPSADG